MILPVRLKQLRNVLPGIPEAAASKRGATFNNSRSPAIKFHGKKGQIMISL
jgi:hypothetical protein